MKSPFTGLFSFWQKIYYFVIMKMININKCSGGYLWKKLPKGLWRAIGGQF